MKGQVNYKGCAILWSPELGAYYWEDQNFGAESDGLFHTVDDAKADIDRSIGGTSSPDEIDDLLAAEQIARLP